MANSCTPAERWLGVPDWEEFYEVSDLGRVRSLPRYTRTGMRGGIILTPVMQGPPGYLYPAVNLSVHGAKRIRKVHQLVLRAFVGPPPPGMTDGCHNDGNPMNCALTNLRWDTHAANGQDMSRHGRARGPGDGSAHPQAKLTEDLVLAIRAEWANRHVQRVTQRELGARYGVHNSVISLIVRHRIWDHI